MTTYTIFSTADGRALRTIDCDESQISENVGADQVAKEGRYCLYSTVLNGEGTPSPKPGVDIEWMDDTRWRLSPPPRRREAAVMARINYLQDKQGRAVREHLLGIVPTEEDRAAGAMTLQEIEDEIAQLREMLNSD